LTTNFESAITVTYVPYIAAELPSNLVLKKIGPRIMLPGMVFMWGVVTTLQSLVKSYSGLLACRFFLGLFEGGLFPGIVLYLSGFYRPHELQVRVGLFFSASALSGAFSGLLAAGIQQMDGIGNLHGWQWIFLLEGLFTVVFASLCFWLLPNHPQGVKSFKKVHADHCEYRLTLDSNSVDGHKFHWKGIFSIFKDLHVWLNTIALFCSGTSLFGLAYFTPSIVQTLGYNPTNTQLLTVPPFVIAFIATMISAYFADRYRQRGLSAIVCTTLAIIGFALFLTAKSFGQKYTALCFLITGIYSAAPAMISWVPNNTSSHTRRASAVALAFIFTNSGGILSTWIYPKKDAPQYAFAAKLNLAFCVLTIALVSANILWLRFLNRRKESRREELLRDVKHLSLGEQREVLGDAHPDYKYTL
jgi:MFS family permease